MINMDALKLDPKAKDFLAGLEDYTQKFNAMQALRVYGIDESQPAYVVARDEMRKAGERLISGLFPEYVS